MKKVIISSLMFLSLCITACTAQDKTDSESDNTMTTDSTSPQYLGGISPEEALEYMKSTPDLYLIDVRTAEWRNPVFKGAVYIPHDEVASVGMVTDFTLSWPAAKKKRRATYYMRRDIFSGQRE